MRIATWNVNSIKQRMDNILAWLDERAPDVVCLQETKCPDEGFPRLEFEARGYNVAMHGQKAFNGVAILSNGRWTSTRAAARRRHVPARALEAVVSTARRGARRLPLSAQHPPDGTNIHSKSDGWNDSSTTHHHAWN
jgi:exodeoxyribonuclease-3